MHKVLTAICNPAARRLDAALMGEIADWLEARAGAAPGRAILADGVAADFAFTAAEDDMELQRAAQETFAERAVDIAVQDAHGRRKRLLIADMDSTIIEQECIDELADYAGKRAEISAITERAMRGELDFEGALIERVAMLEGLPEAVLFKAFAERITLTPGARTLIQTMKQAGAVAALVSGGFTFFTRRVADAVGFDINEANTLLIENGELTGDVARPIKGRQAKEDALVRIAADNEIHLRDTMAVGDGANDLAMLARAGSGVAFHAKPAVAEAARFRIDHGDLTALLYLQGFRETKFVS